MQSRTPYMRSSTCFMSCLTLVAGWAIVLTFLVPTRADLSQGASELQQGQKLFETHCAVCHGPRGEGGKGPTLAQPKLPRATDDAALMRIIREGIGGTEMPGVRMERGNVPLVAAFVKSLGSRPPEVVPGDPQRGGELYAKAQCAKC